MRAFDTAWDLLKAPLDVGSIDYEHKLEDMQTPVAFFDDPVTGERVPMFVNKLGNHYVRVGRDNPNDVWDARAKAKLDTGGRNIAEGKVPYATMHPDTKEEFRRRGYATSMYDLIAYLLSHHGGGELGPSDVQTQEGRDFWQNTQMGGEEYPAEFDRLYLGAPGWVEPPEDLIWRPTV